LSLIFTKGFRFRKWW